MNQIARRIVELALLDKPRRVFGAKTHNYVGTPLSERELRELERDIDGQLPPDYRSFLAEIGAGVGPYYGLLSVKRIREELQIIAEDHLAENGARAKPSDPFGLETQILELRQQAANDFPALSCPPTPGGFVPICHQGCEFITVLIVTGACEGLVMDATNFASTHSDWYPSKCPPGIVEYGRHRAPIQGFPRWPSFIDWIDGWLRQSEADLQG